MSSQLYSEVEVNLQTALEVGLTEEEYNKILNFLGRTPTYTEIGIYGVMWSEHCSYKNSIAQLKTLPRSGAKLLVEAGEENAGLVDIGNGYAIAFKIESHNHPSAIEPFQGAATGVGGILRDIFTMGARPIAALNSLRFGELTEERNKFLLRGVVKGISHYGNAFGVPTVGGEIYFDECYTDNPLVNAMAVGIVKTDRTASASAKGPGNPVMIIGSRTGRDGIHGASLLASREFDEQTEDMRPTVQVGDPFAEKLLLEASLELIKAGVIVAIQDMGAAGISCSTSEMSAKNSVGMDIDLDKTPLRESDMSAYEIMLSESQERMLAVIEKGKEDIARKICEKWDVPMTHIGVITDDGLVHISRHGKKVAELEAETLVLGGKAPVNIREQKEPEYISKIQSEDLSEYDRTDNLKEAFEKLITSPNIASKKWIFEQYDSQVRTNTVSIKGDAAIIRLKEIPGKGIAVCTDCNGRFSYLNPYRGAMIAVAEAARNCAVVGAEPAAITNCLNFGNPYNPEKYWQFAQAIKGMGDACRTLGTPVTDGNVSFHNESQRHAVYPTPVIGMLGVIDDLDKTCSLEFKKEGDFIVVLGENKHELGGSEYLKVMFNKVAGNAPELDIEVEKRLQKLILELIRSKTVNSAHDCSEGGMAITLAEMAIKSNGIGVHIKLANDNPKASCLYGESQSRIIVTCDKANYFKLLELCEEYSIQTKKIGETVKDNFVIDGVFAYCIKEIQAKYDNAIENLLNKRD